MRVYTELEKRILRELASRVRVSLITLIDPWLSGTGFTLDTTTNKVDVHFEAVNPTVPPPDLQNKLDGIQELLIQAVNVIELLERTGHVFTYQTANVIPNPITFGQLPASSAFVTYTLPDSRVSALLCRYARQDIRAQEELSKFINDGFITREEGRANRQWRTTRSALIVAILALAGNLGYNIMKDCHTGVWKQQQQQRTFVPHCHGR